MPITDQRTDTKWSGSYTNGTVTYQMAGSASKMAGFYKSISALNRGLFRPGEYRCNNTTIQQFFATAGEVGFLPTKVGTYTYQASGALGAHCAAGHQPGGQYVNPSAWDEARAKEALNRAYAKLAAPELDVGVMLGELPETLAGLRHPLSALRKAAKDFKKWQDIAGSGPDKPRSKRAKARDRKAAKRSLMAGADGATGTLLEWRYGISPLISSVQDIIAYVNAAIKQFHDKLQRRRARGASVKKTMKYFKADTGAGAFRIDSEAVVYIEDQYSASVSYKALRPPSIDELLGFDFLSLPGIAWELTTLSFVVDWFFSVGKWLDALKSILSSRFKILGGSVSRKTTINTILSITNVDVSGVRVSTTGAGNCFECTSLTLTRKCYPPQRATDLMPQMNSAALQFAQQLDLTALAWQKASKRIR